MREATTDSVAAPKNVVSVAIPACKDCGGAKLQWPSKEELSELGAVNDGRTEFTESKIVEQKDADNVNSDKFCWREFNSVVPGLTLLLSFGLQQAYSFYLYSEIVKLQHMELSSSSLVRALSFVTILSYYVGALVGNLLAGFIARTLKKKTIYCLCGFIQIIAGSALLYTRWGIEVEVPSRLIAGIAHGIAYVTVSIHASDAVSPSTRKIISTAITTTAGVAVVCGFVLLDISVHTLAPTILGTTLIALAALTILTAVILTHETVPHYLTNKDESKALKAFTKLSGGEETIVKPNEAFNEIKSITEEDKLNGINILGGGNFRPLFVVILAKTVNMIWSFLFINQEQFDSMKISFHVFARLPICAMPITKLIFGSIFLYLSNWFGRYRLIYGISIFLAVFEFGQYTVSYLVDYNKAHLLTGVFTYCWLLGGIAITFGLDSYQQRLTTEAFTTTKRKWSISVASIYENILYVLLSYVFVLIPDRLHFNWGTSFVSIFLTVTLLAMIPNTANLSLREIRNRFNKTFLKSNDQTEKV